MPPGFIFSDPDHSAFRGFMIKQMYYHLRHISFNIKGGKVNMFPFKSLFLNQKKKSIFMIGHLMRYGSLGEF